MAEQLSMKIKANLEKVSKLDSISLLVQNIEATFVDLEERAKKLEYFQKSASKDIEDLKESCNYMDGKIDSLKDAQDQLSKASTLIQGLTEKLKESDKKINRHEKEFEDLKSKDLYLEAYSRRENIKFLNINESEDEDVENVLRSFLRDDLYYEDYEYVEIPIT
jgi:predicted RNase H-like nuclease (RuvC/YqgF family)